MKSYYRITNIYPKRRRPRKPKRFRNLPGTYQQIKTYSWITEYQLEEKIIDILKKQGYEYTFGKDCKRKNTKEILLIEDLKKYLSNPKIEEIVLDYLTKLPKNVDDAHAIIWNYIQNGIWIEALKQRVFLIDFNKPNNNCFRVVNQLIIKTKTKTRIPDVVIYINGLPLVVFELKTPKITSVILILAYNQLVKTYLKNIPELFKYSLFLVISNYYSHKYGTIRTKISEWHSWTKNNSKKLTNLLTDLFNRETLIDYIENYIYIFDKKTTGLIGSGGYFRISRAIKDVINTRNNEIEFRSDNYYETIVLIRKITKTEKFKNYSIIWFVDNSNKRISDILCQINSFIKVNTQILNKEELQTRIKDNGIYLTNIQDYLKEPFLLTKEKNLICISNRRYASIRLKRKIWIMRIKNFFGFKNNYENIYFNPKHRTFLDYLKVSCPNAMQLIKN